VRFAVSLIKIHTKRALNRVRTPFDMKSLNGPGKVLTREGMKKANPVCTKLAIIATIPDAALLLTSVRYKFYAGSWAIPTKRVKPMVKMMIPIFNSSTSHIPMAKFIKPANAKPSSREVLRLKRGTTTTDKAFAKGSIIDIKFKVIVAV
jgi:hypothetical protein